MLVPGIPGKAEAAHHLQTNTAACSHPQRSRRMKGNDQKGRSDGNSSGSHKIFPLVEQRLMGTASCGAGSRDDGESWANARAKQQEGEETPLPATPMALPHVTPVHRDPFDLRAPQQAAIPIDREDCNLIFYHVKYKYTYTNTHHTGMDVKKSALTGILYGISAAQTSLVLTPMRMGHEGSETQRKAL